MITQFIVVTFCMIYGISYLPFFFSSLPLSYHSFYFFISSYLSFLSSFFSYFFSSFLSFFLSFFPPFLTSFLLHLFFLSLFLSFFHFFSHLFSLFFFFRYSTRLFSLACRSTFLHIAYRSTSLKRQRLCVRAAVRTYYIRTLVMTIKRY